jgi:hypothetical protein
MKYLEELKPGALFVLNNEKFILTADFKQYKNQKSKKMAINLETGFVNWVLEDAIVEILDLYYRDKDANIIALKERKNEYVEKGQDIS